MGQVLCQVLAIQKRADIKVTSPLWSLESAGRCDRESDDHTYRYAVHYCGQC